LISSSAKGHFGSAGSIRIVDSQHGTAADITQQAVNVHTDPAVMDICCSFDDPMAYNSRKTATGNALVFEAGDQ